MKRMIDNRRFVLILTVLTVFWVATSFSLIGGQETSQPVAESELTVAGAESALVDSTEPVDANQGHNETSGEVDDGAGHGSKEVSEVLLGLIVILLAAKVGGDLVERINQPAVLGELMIGMIIGNLYLVGIDIFEPFKHSATLEVLAELGVIILLFEVGLESTIGEMLKVGMVSFAVATFGVVVPFFLGWGVGLWFLPNESTYVHVFIGATLTATSVGITARVLQDIGKSKIREAKIILGAAVIDDIMGLIILAVVSAIIAAANAGGSLDSGAILFIVFKAVGFVVAALFLGKALSPVIFKIGSKLHGKGVLLSLALLVCFTLSFLADLIGLAAIVGAFSAGLILESVHFKVFRERGEREVEELIAPIATFLVPIFFVRMGMLVKLETFVQVDILLFAGVMTIVAIIGKQACSLAVLQKGINRVAIGLGMVPRGEVGLIFAGIGAKLMLDGHPVVSDSTFSAIVIMVIVTTMVTPPFLKWSLLKGEKKAA